MGVLWIGSGVLPATAQQPDSIEADTTARAGTPASADSLKRKSPGRAILYSLGGTVLLTPAHGAGLVVGPSFGHFYTRNYTQALVGIGIRIGGAVLVIRGFTESFSLFSNGNSAEGEMQITVGAILLVGSAIFDIVTSWHAAQHYNESLASNVSIAPTAGPRLDQAGLSLRIQF